ncbi:MAG TPA: globin [Cyanobacteria bacterium UBA11149]|nr:globin [Cyanobacteria bacterium UBA11367]HBE59649.1 globin [Cyanobacteria bacterium UBA11366]HBK66166.1 globin [Cyanobacteria bacterium UBA11166]HBR75832.1 globin [Cyanobacteria bacterium UBA11159]HBS72559.1 globin [Cyanobacteria bacterium UBA11153]HBW87349.1 globin [Cyanobacteria bacterium UBA11149]HCA97565.1 globin [Cyanobacteria bacterium UBA9226]
METPLPVESDSTELPIELLEQSFDKVKLHANEFASSFYDNLFTTYPELKHLFTKTDMKEQEKKLLNSLVLVVENLRNPEVLEPVLNALGARHVSYGAIPKYYGPVQKAILMTFEQYLQEDWTGEVKEAWTKALRAITAQMLKGAGASPTVVQKTKTEELEIPEKSKAGIINEVKPAIQSGEFNKKPFISIEVNTELFKEFVTQLKFNTSKIKPGNLMVVIKNIPRRISKIFWKTPASLIVLLSASIFTIFFVSVDENSLLGKALGGTDAISLVIAVVLFIKEAPDRKKQFHYQAWSIIDNANNIHVSYARVLALQDLNADGVSLRELQSPRAQLDKINLHNADLSEANLSEADLNNSDLSNSNFSNANLNKAILNGANLSHANLSFSSLSQANLSSANLSHANLVCTDLSNANMTGANLINATLGGANLKNTCLLGANLKNAQVTNSELSSALLEGAIMPDGSKYKSGEMK